MILIALEDDKNSISKRFRKSEYFAFIDNENIIIEKNIHKKSKSNEFFEYFKNLGVKKVYLKALGYKTFKKLEELGVEVYFVNDTDRYDKIEPKNLIRVDSNSAKELCTLGHK